MPTRVGSSAIVNTSANSGSSSITVPTCNLALLQWYGLGGGTNLMTSMSLDGVTGTEIGQSPGTAASAGSFGCGGFYVKSPAAGSKTFAWDFNGTGGFTEGGILAISFFDSVDVSGEPVRDWGVDCADETADLTDTLTTASDDFVHIGAISYGSSCNTGITGQTTDQEPAAYDNGYVDLAHVNSPGSSTTPVAANGAFYGAAFFVALKNSGGGGVTGTLAKTNANDTSTGSGSTTVIGSVSKTNANDTSAAAGRSTVNGSLAKANAPDVLSAAGSPVATGTLSKTNAADTLAASGSVGSAVTGTVAYTNANDTLSAAGNVAIPGSLARTNADDASTASGSPTVNGSLAKTNANDTISASGSPVVTGSASITNANDALAAYGTVNASVTGSVNYTNQPDALAASGTVAITGSASTTNANDTLESQAPRLQNTSGGAVIVDLPKKKRKKSLKKRVDEPVEALPQVIPQDLTEEQVKGMEAIYGAQMRPAVEAMPAEAPPEVVEQLADAIIEPFEAPASVFAEPEPVSVDQQQDEPVEPEDDIALIMAIIEAIG